MRQRQPRSGVHHHARHPAGAAAVSVHVRDLSQMFSSLDPSPFWDRDLDQNAATFIEDEFRDKRTAADWHLNVHTQENAALAGDLQTAVENYYGRMANIARRELLEHDEGLIILGWIALWRPAEMLAYEWIPLVRKRRLYERLAGVRVAVRSDMPSAAAVSAK
jgi:hypothetical protein